jgi:uncharacterized membrane protein
MENNNQKNGEQQSGDVQPFKPTQEKNVGMAVVAYILFFVPLLTEAKNDPFVKYHVKQGLILFICAIVASIVVEIVDLFFIAVVIRLGILVFILLGVMNALHGKKEPLPFIGQYEDKFTL